MVATKVEMKVVHWVESLVDIMAGRLVEMKAAMKVDH